jgi:hypothetical protein
MTLTVQQVLLDARTRVGEPATQYPSDPVGVVWCNMAAQELYDVVIDQEMYQVSYMSSSVTQGSIVTPAGDLGIFLPSDFYRMLALDRLTNGSPGMRLNVPRCHYSQRNAAVGAGLGAACGTYWLRYYPQMPALSSLQSTLLPIFEQPGWWEYVSLSLCVKIQTALEKDPTVFERQMAEALQRIRRAAPNRDVNFGLRLDPNRGRQRSNWPWNINAGVGGGYAATAPYGPQVGYLLEGSSAIVLVPGGQG